MSDEKKYTERDLILAKRDAFMDGVIYERASLPFSSRPHGEQRKRYPLPKVTRPRRVTSAASGLTYEAWGSGGGIIITRSDGTCISDAGCRVPCVQPIDAVIVADLLKTPTETVEAES